MKIIVDAFGGDNAPLEILKGCEMAVKEYNLEIILTGNRQKIEEVSNKNEISLKNMEIVNCSEVITMNDKASDVIKAKKDSSMAVGLKLLAENKGEAFISAGNSGALVMGATMIVKRIKGIKRCAFAPIIPKNKGCFMLIDSGANIDCKPEMLYQFGLMGFIYMKNVMKIKNPRIGLINVGTEEHKGGELQHKTYELLKNSYLNFIGNIEAREVPDDAADVVVTDGFTGNIMLKMYEGVSMTLMIKIKEIFKKGIISKIAGAMILPNIKKLKKELDYNEYGGAPIIGACKPVFKAHGSAKANTFKNALRLTSLYVKSDIINKISTEVTNLKKEEIELKDND